MKKFEFTDKTIEANGIMLRRIRVLYDFGSLGAGELSFVSNYTSR